MHAQGPVSAHHNRSWEPDPKTLATVCGECFCQAAWAAIEAPGNRAAQKIARIASARLNNLLRGLLFYVCNKPIGKT